MRVRDLFNKSGGQDVVSVGRQDSVTLASQKMYEHRIGCVVVTDSAGRLVGLLSERDVLRRCHMAETTCADTKVEQVMTVSVQVCSPDMTLADVESLMVNRGIRHIPVVCEGKTVAMLSARDLMKWRADEQKRVHELTVFSLAKLAESRDMDTGMHLERVREYTTVVARRLLENHSYADQIDDRFIRLVRAGSALHDIGKVSIPDCVLLKPDRLTQDEFEIMKTHTTRGAATLEEVLVQHQEATFIKMARDIALSHHERWDGTGYPQGLGENEIPLAARIFAVSDVYDALVSRRIYKEPFSHTVAAKIIAEGQGTHFDPQVVRAFLSESDRFKEILDQYSDVEKAAA